MKRAKRLSATCVFMFLAISSQSVADQSAGSSAGFAALRSSIPMLEPGAPVPKSAGAQTLGSRGTVTSSATLYGGFQLTTTAVVYILVRGNSLGTLGITQGYLDAPRVRIYNRQGQDIAFDVSGNAGFNFCRAPNTFATPVLNYYRNVRGEAAGDRDSCTSGTLAPGVYTFSVTPSIPGVTSTDPAVVSTPSFGEVLFEVTLNP